MPNLRVMTYNIHHGADSAEQPRLDDVVAFVADADPDVVCLQEVDRRYGPRSGNADQAAELADRLAMHLHFAPALYRGEGQYGNAVLSKAPQSSRAVHRLSTPPRAETRTVAATRTEPGNAAVTVLCVHLTPGRRRATRAAQLRELADLAADSAPPVVLAGDFNTDDAGELAVLAPQLQDAWTAAGHTASAGATSPTWLPLRRIDRVYVPWDVEVTRAEVGRCAASDHRPMVVDLTLAGRSSVAVG